MSGRNLTDNRLLTRIMKSKTKIKSPSWTKIKINIEMVN